MVPSPTSAGVSPESAGDLADRILPDVEDANDDAILGDAVEHDVLLGWQTPAPFEEVGPRNAKVWMVEERPHRAIEPNAIAGALFGSPLETGVSQRVAHVAPRLFENRELACGGSGQRSCFVGPSRSVGTSGGHTFGSNGSPRRSASSASRSSSSHNSGVSSISPPLFNPS